MAAVTKASKGAETGEAAVARATRGAIGAILAIPAKVMPLGKKEEAVTKALKNGLARTGLFYRTRGGEPLFFRHHDRRLYEITARQDTEFARFATYLADQSFKLVLMARAVDRIAASVSQQARITEVYGMAYNDVALDTIAINDFGGGMWIRNRGGKWKWQPNGYNGILFWQPSAPIEPWKPLFGKGPVEDEQHLRWFIEQPHFAEDILSVEDQRLIFRALLLAPFFPSLSRIRPIQAHLGLNRQRQHDTGKTSAGKIIGLLLVGPKFEPMPAPEGTERGIEAVQLELMHQPFVLLDNVDTDLKWLNDFLCTYATGARPSKRKLYTDTQQVHVDYRGRLCLTSRKAKFNRVDVASRTVPFRFKPIPDADRKTEWEVVDPIIERRGQIWAGLLAVTARLQDAAPNLRAPRPRLRLADFEQFGWMVAEVHGEGTKWLAAMERLKTAQAGFALETEVLFPIFKKLLESGDVTERPTSKFWTEVANAASELDLIGPLSAAECTK